MRTLRRTEEERQAIMEETNDRPYPPQRTTFYDHVVQTFFDGNEQRMFTGMNINRAFFDAAFNLIDSVPISTRGRPGFIHSHRDKLLFLIIFLTRGTSALEQACLPILSSPTAILHNLHQAANLFCEPLTRNSILFLDEQADGLPLFSAIVDCTVVQIKGPDTPFRQQDRFYSGKHKRHCLKKEVVVNIRSGRAAMVSAEYPGSVPDLEVLRRHSNEVNAMLGETRMLADKGYRGDTGVPNCVVVSSAVEKRQRLMVERFFGRLKNYFIVFSRIWDLSPGVSQPSSISLAR